MVDLSDLDMMTNDVMHAKRGSTKHAKEILRSLKFMLEQKTVLPESLSQYLIECCEKILQDIPADRAFNLSGKQGGQYSEENWMHEYEVARVVFYRKLKNPKMSIEEICGALEDDKVFLVIAKRKSDKKTYLKADRIKGLYNKYREVVRVEYETNCEPYPQYRKSNIG